MPAKCALESCPEMIDPVKVEFRVPKSKDHPRLAFHSLECVYKWQEENFVGAAPK